MLFCTRGTKTVAPNQKSQFRQSLNDSITVTNGFFICKISCQLLLDLLSDINRIMKNSSGEYALPTTGFFLNLLTHPLH